MEPAASLQHAIASGRLRPDIVINPFHDNKTSPVAEGLIQEDFELYSEESVQGWVPVRVITSINHQYEEQETPGKRVRRRLPVVIFVHDAGENMDSMRSKQEEYARAGYLALAMNIRNHGVRTDIHGYPRQHRIKTTISTATARQRLGGVVDPFPLVQPPLPPFKGAQIGGVLEKGFLRDTLWDLNQIVSYLIKRPDVMPDRIGMTGINVGGMLTWLCAAADERVAVAAPIIEPRSLTWAMCPEAWESREGFEEEMSEVISQRSDSRRSRTPPSSSQHSPLPSRMGSPALSAQRPSSPSSAPNQPPPVPWTGDAESLDFPTPFTFTTPRPLLVAMSNTATWSSNIRQASHAVTAAYTKWAEEEVSAVEIICAEEEREAAAAAAAKLEFELLGGDMLPSDSSRETTPSPTTPPVTPPQSMRSPTPPPPRGSMSWSDSSSEQPQPPSRGASPDLMRGQRSKRSTGSARFSTPEGTLPANAAPTLTLGAVITTGPSVNQRGSLSNPRKTPTPTFFLTPYMHVRGSSPSPTPYRRGIIPPTPANTPVAANDGSHNETGEGEQAVEDLRIDLAEFGFAVAKEYETHEEAVARVVSGRLLVHMEKSVVLNEAAALNRMVRRWFDAYLLRLPDQGW